MANRFRLERRGSCQPGVEGSHQLQVLVRAALVDLALLLEALHDLLHLLELLKEKA